MVNVVVLVATVVAIVMAIAAFITLSMELYVASGTFFVFTSIAIYVRETH